MDALRDRNNDIVCGLKQFFYIAKESVLVESHFRQVDQVRSSGIFISRKRGRSGEPAGIPSHDLNDRDTFYRIDKGVVRDLENRGGDVFCGGTKSRGMVGFHQVVVDGFWNADDTDVTSDLFRVV